MIWYFITIAVIVVGVIMILIGNKSRSYDNWCGICGWCLAIIAGITLLCLIPFSGYYKSDLYYTDFMAKYETAKDWVEKGDNFLNTGNFDTVNSIDKEIRDNRNGLNGPKAAWHGPWSNKKVADLPLLSGK